VKTKFVKILFDVTCEWEGLPPDYRIFVNEELFCERTYDYDSQFYLKEMIQVNATPGLEHKVRLEKVGPQIGDFHFKNHQIAYTDSPVRLYKIKDTSFRFSIT
jgi:hypothetical protein